MTFADFLQMGGYAPYIWTAYAIVIAWLFIQWFIPFKRFRAFLRKKKT